MILIGRYLSPFVRRSATVLNLLGLAHEQRVVATEEDGDFIRRYNPLGRVPALVIGEETVVDSNAIVDYALELALPNTTLLAASGTERRRTRYLSAIAFGTMEKTVASAYEVRMRPAEFVYEPYRNRLQQQMLAGLQALEQAYSQLLSAANQTESLWFGGAAPDLADVDAVVAFDQSQILAKELVEQTQLPGLARLSEQANALPAFAATQWRSEPA